MTEYNPLVTLHLPGRFDGYWIEVDPELIVGMYQMKNRPETRLTFEDGSSVLVKGTIPEVCRELYKKRGA